MIKLTFAGLEKVELPGQRIFVEHSRSANVNLIRLPGLSLAAREGRPVAQARGQVLL